VTIKGIDHDVLAASDDGRETAVSRGDLDSPYEYQELDPNRYLFQSEDIHLLTNAPESLKIRDIIQGEKSEEVKMLLGLRSKESILD
jgi:hypothetical protein